MPHPILKRPEIVEKRAVSRHWRYRTWTAFSIALFSLLALMVLPAFNALRRSRQIYEQIRTMQNEQERSHRILDDVTRNLFRTSVLIREFLLDSSPDTNSDYRTRFSALRATITDSIATLEKNADQRNAATLRQLHQIADSYWSSVEPVFKWAPAERSLHGTYFLRQEQRPRRESILAITDEIRRVNDTFYRKQFEAVNQSEQSFRDDVQRVMALSLLAGILIAAASVVRISWLERRFLEQHEAAQRTGDEMRNLSMQLRHAQEDERKAISRELHDEVGQKLTALRMELGTLDRLRHSTDGAFSEHLTETKQLAEQSLRTIRELAAGLRPSVLDDLGIGPALQRQAREFGKHTGLPVSVEIAGELDGLPEQHKVYVYRIVQESLTNCAKHAHAKKIAVSVSGENGEVTVCVQDDGVGFHAESPTAGAGLLGIEERVRELGGTMEIASQPGGGTRLKVRLPLRTDT
ncbi:MAG: sensor histidine kinase [Bryobacteraceae bacterium]